MLKRLSLPNALLLKVSLRTSGEVESTSSFRIPPTEAAGGLLEGDGVAVGVPVVADGDGDGVPGDEPDEPPPPTKEPPGPPPPELVPDGDDVGDGVTVGDGVGAGPDGSADDAAEVADGNGMSDMGAE